VDINKALLFGLFTHPLAPLVGSPLILIGLYAWLLQPLMTEHWELANQLQAPTALTEWSQPPRDEQLYVFDIFADVIPWIMENAAQAGLSVIAIAQTSEQDGLLIDLHGGFPQFATFIERSLSGTNLLVQPPLIIAPTAPAVADLRVSVHLVLASVACLKQCKKQRPVAQPTQLYGDGFGGVQPFAVMPGGHVLQEQSVQQLLWVGRLILIADNYELVRIKNGDVVLVASESLFGIEGVTVQDLPGWTAHE
jgi:hypothetical protein